MATWPSRPEDLDVGVDLEAGARERQDVLCVTGDRQVGVVRLVGRADRDLDRGRRLDGARPGRAEIGCLEQRGDRLGLVALRLLHLRVVGVCERGGRQDEPGHERGRNRRPAPHAEPVAERLSRIWASADSNRTSWCSAPTGAITLKEYSTLPSPKKTKSDNNLPFPAVPRTTTVAR